MHASNEELLLWMTVSAVHSSMLARNVILQGLECSGLEPASIERACIQCKHACALQRQALAPWQSHCKQSYGLGTAVCHCYVHR